MLDKLLLDQYLLKSGLNLTKNDLTEIQSADSKLSKTITEMKRQNITILGDFELHGGILYKIKTIYSQKCFRMCLPGFLGREIYNKLHHKNEAHLTIDNLKTLFESNLYTPNSEKSQFFFRTPQRPHPIFDPNRVCVHFTFCCNECTHYAWPIHTYVEACGSNTLLW